MEHNGKLYDQSTNFSLQVFEHIKEAIQIRPVGLRKIASTPANRQLCNCWNYLIIFSSSFLYIFFVINLVKVFFL